MRRMRLMQAMPKFTTPGHLPAPGQYGKATNFKGDSLHLTSISDGLPITIGDVVTPEGPPEGAASTDVRNA